MAFGFGFGLTRGSTIGVAVPDPVLGLSFVGSGPIDPRVTFSRATGATVVRNTGYMDDIAANLARFDYNPATLEARGLLIEQASSNQLLYAEQLSRNSSWTPTNCGVTSNAVQSPFAALKAERLTSTAAGAAYIQQNIVATNTTYTFSVFLAIFGANNGVKLQIYDVTTSTIVATYTAASIASGTPYASGFYRHSMTTTAVTNGNTIGFRIYTDSTDTGGGTAVCAFGAQAEPGMTFPTSYMRSFGTSFSRAADLASITGTNFTDWFNGTTGTFYAEGAPITSTPNPYSFLIEGYTGSVAGTFTIGTGGTTAQFGLDVRNAAALNAKEDIATTFTVGGIKKGAVAYDSTPSAALVLNASVITPTATAPTATATSLYIGCRGGTSNFWNGWVRSIRFYNSKLTNTQMQSITS